MTIAIIMRSAEAKLVDMLSTIRDPQGWQAVHFKLSDLLEQYQSEYQVKIAINLINDLLKTYEGGIFLLQDHGIIVLVQQLEKTVLNKLVFQLRYLYMDDPLAYTDEGHENPDFCTIYDLARDWNGFAEMCNRRMAAAARKTTQPERQTESSPRTPVLESVRTVTPAASAPSQPSQVSAGLPLFEAIEAEIRSVDLASVMRRQPVCVVGQNFSARRLFDECYLHIPQLRQVLVADSHMLTNRWLFKYLSCAMDERVLDLIRRDAVSLRLNPVSINLNVETLLSEHFDAFDAMLAPEIKSSVVLELPVVDVFADMSAFTLARSQAQKMGYRVCLDGLTINSFINIDRKRLSLDLLKVQWNADVESDLSSRQNVELAKAVADCGHNRVILCRCDNKLAVDYGHGLGITLFQGRFIDSLVTPTLAVAN